MKVGEKDSNHASRNEGSFFKAFFLNSSCLMYVHNQGVWPISHLENTWVDMNEENNRCVN